MISLSQTVVRLLPSSVTPVDLLLSPCRTLILIPLATIIHAREMLQFVLVAALAANKLHAHTVLLSVSRVTPMQMAMLRFAFRATVWSTTVGARPPLTTSQSTRIMTSLSIGMQMFLAKLTTPRPTLGLSLPPKISCAISKEHQAQIWALGVNMKNILVLDCGRCHLLLLPMVVESNLHRMAMEAGLAHRNKCSLLLVLQSLEASFLMAWLWATWMQLKMKSTLWMIASSTLHQPVKCTITA